MVMDRAAERAAAMRHFGAADFSGAIGVLRRLAAASDDLEDRLVLGRLAYVAISFSESQARLEPRQ
jgi:hypothetical protein